MDPLDKICSLLVLRTVQLVQEADAMPGAA